MALTDKSSIVIPKGFYGKANVLQGFNPQTENLVDLDVVRNTTATRVNEQGLIESVAANVPRRDFLNGGCGELLVEPQRTNLLTYSEQFDNAAWTKTNATITANATTSPDGTVSADKLVEDATNNFHRVQSQSISVTFGNTYSFLFFAKKDERDVVQLVPSGSTFGGSSYVNFDLTNGVVSASSGADNTDIKLVGDFYLCKATYTATKTTSTEVVNYFLATSPTSSRVESYAGDGSSGLFIWGAQFEEGSYPTSYIPTTASAVTRNEDVISLSNAEELIGDSEGGIFVEASVFDSSAGNFLSLINSGFTNDLFGIGIGSNKFRFTLNKDNTNFIFQNNGTAASNTNYKIAARLALNDAAIYVDGSQNYISNSNPVFDEGDLDRIDISIKGRIRQLVVFDQALTDAELAAITS